MLRTGTGMDVACVRTYAYVVFVRASNGYGYGRSTAVEPKLYCDKYRMHAMTVSMRLYRSLL